MTMNLYVPDEISIIGNFASLLLLFALVFGCANVHALDRHPEGPRYVVELTGQLDMAGRGLLNLPLKKYQFLVIDKASGEKTPIAFGGDSPNEAVVGNLRDFAVSGNRLVIVTTLDIGVIDLDNGNLKALMVCPSAEIAPGGKWVACQLFHQRFTPPEQMSDVACVLDTKTIELWSVFPETKKDDKCNVGEQIVKLSDQYHFDTFYWSPNGKLLVVAVKQGDLSSAEDLSKLKNSIVVIDLSNGPQGSSYRTIGLRPDVYMKAGVEPKENIDLFGVGSVKWMGADSIQIIPPTDYWWMKDAINVHLPIKSVDDGGGK